MKRGCHTPSEPGKAAGRQCSTRRAGRKGSGRYGAGHALFNVMPVQCDPPHSPADAGPSLSPPGRGERLSPSPRLRGEGRGEGRLRQALAAGMALLFITTPPMARVPVILAFGDSRTAGYGVTAPQAFPARREAWLHEREIAARVVNAG